MTAPTTLASSLPYGVKERDQTACPIPITHTALLGVALSRAAPQLHEAESLAKKLARLETDQKVRSKLLVQRITQACSAHMSHLWRVVRRSNHVTFPHDTVRQAGSRRAGQEGARAAARAKGDAGRERGGVL